MNLGHLESDLRFLSHGLKLTIELAILSLIVAVFLGLFLAIGRMSKRPLLRVPAAAYVTIFLSTPILVQLLWMYYVLPQETGLLLSDLQVLVLALGLHTAASMAEVYRGGLLAVSPGQRDASTALGLSRLQALRFVVLPQALLFMLPALANVLIDIVKDTSLATFIGAPDLLNEGRSFAIDTFRPIEIFTLVAVMYFILTYPISRLSAYLERFVPA